MYHTMARTLSHNFLQTSTNSWASCIRKCLSKKALPSINPLTDVQAYTKEKLFREEDKIFQPTAKEVEESEKLFIPRKKFNEIKFVGGAYYPEQAPEYQLKEVRYII